MRTFGRLLALGAAAALCAAAPAAAAKPKAGAKAPPKAAPAAAPAKAKAPRKAGAPRVLAARFSGVISPVASEFMVAAVERAAAEGYDAVVLELDTPGGLDTSMRVIVKAILHSKTAVIVFVHPPGARSASAGVFITMAAHVAAMAPGTNIGAAHPILLGGSNGSESPRKGKGKGKDDDGEESRPGTVLEDKMANDAAAYLRSIAQERGRNAEWAYQAVRLSSSVPATEAVRLGVVDLTAGSLEELLKAVDGRAVKGLKAPLRTAGAAVDRVEMTRRQRILAALSDPNVAMILMSLGTAGLLIELYNPGLILPGIVGAISLLLAFYSFETLSASYAGVLLILLGLVLFLLEIKIISYGMLALGGTTAVVLGMLMLFREHAVMGLGVSVSVMVGTLAGMLGATGLCAWLVWSAWRRGPTTGAEAMVGAKGRARTALDPGGKVFLQGELWDAEAAGGGSIAQGAEVIVEAVDGLTLKVRAK